MARACVFARIGGTCSEVSQLKASPAYRGRGEQKDPEREREVPVNEEKKEIKRERGSEEGGLDHILSATYIPNSL
jgi:hypothetical protein